MFPHFLAAMETEKNKKEKRSREEARREEDDATVVLNGASKRRRTITFKNFPNMDFAVVRRTFYPHHIFGPMTLMMEVRDVEKETVVKQPDGTSVVTRKVVPTPFALLPGRDGGVTVHDKREYLLQRLTELPPRRVVKKDAAPQVKEEQ
jgi:hypothetical protein